MSLEIDWSETYSTEDDKDIITVIRREKPLPPVGIFSLHCCDVCRWKPYDHIGDLPPGAIVLNLTQYVRPSWNPHTESPEPPEPLDPTKTHYVIPVRSTLIEEIIVPKLRKKHNTRKNKRLN